MLGYCAYSIVTKKNLMCLAAAEPGAALDGPSWDAVYGRDRLLRRSTIKHSNDVVKRWLC